MRAAIAKHNEAATGKSRISTGAGAYSFRGAVGSPIHPTVRPAEHKELM